MQPRVPKADTSSPRHTGWAARPSLLRAVAPTIVPSLTARTQVQPVPSASRRHPARATSLPKAGAHALPSPLQASGANEALKRDARPAGLVCYSGDADAVPSATATGPGTP